MNTSQLESQLSQEKNMKGTELHEERPSQNSTRGDLVLPAKFWIVSFVALRALWLFVLFFCFRCFESADKLTKPN